MELWSYMQDWIATFRFRSLWSHIRYPHSKIMGPPAGLLAMWDRITARRRFPVVGKLWTFTPGISRYHRWRRYFLQEYRRAADTRPDPAAHRERCQRICLLSTTLLPPAIILHRVRYARSIGRIFVHREGGQRNLRDVGYVATLPADLAVHSPVPCGNRPSPQRTACLPRQSMGSLICTVTQPGAYRVEARLADRPWVFTNPIYVGRSEHRPPVR